MSRKKPYVSKVTAVAPPPAGLRVSSMAADSIATPGPVRTFEIKPPELMPGVRPASMAMDDALQGQAMYGYMNQAFCGLGFPGYPFLSELAQRPEYMAPCEIIADESTRAWIKITSQGDGDNADKIEQIEAAFRRHGIKSLMREASLKDSQFGRYQIYINIGNARDSVRASPLVLDSRTVSKGSLKGFKGIEPLWTSPNIYNSIDPTANDFYVPQQWFVMGIQTHATRLLTMISRPMPDLLKPAYNFSGMSLQQLLIPYVDNWIRTRDSVSDAVHNFSITVLHTDLASMLQGGNDQLINRIKLFNACRDNRGLMVVSKGDEEDLTQVNMPLSGLDALQQQAQEQMASVAHIPLIKRFGISPTGLSATAEPELDCFYEYIHSYQEKFFTPAIDVILKLIQLDLFGDIDESIGFEYQPLKQMSGTELAQIRKSDADAAVAYITNGVISPEEERLRIASDPMSGYNSIEAEDVPEMPEDNAGELDGTD